MRISKKVDNTKLIKLFFDPESTSEEVSFPQICKFIREVFNLTQKQIAQKLGITTTGYRYWECGICEPSSKAAFNLCLMYLQAIEVRKIKDEFDKSTMSSVLNQFDKNNLLAHLTDSSSKSNQSSLDAA